jgi:amidophosphoribosyltransferase
MISERPSTDRIGDRDGPRDECGVFGAYAPGRDVARLAYFGLYALQHRGQESAGIATCEGGHITTMRELGLVSQVFDEEKLHALAGDMAIGHVRYSTTGGGAWENAQPVWRDDGRELALAHNGNLTNAVELYNELTEQGLKLRGTSDSEIMAALLSSRAGRGGEWIEDAVAEVMPRLDGAYSTVVMTKHAVVAFRDPHGIRPLALGKLGEHFVVASESCAFDIIGAKLIREVQPGELVSLTERGLEMKQVIEGERPAMCVFEHIYFSRPDTRLENRVLQEVRGRMGEILARQAPVEADLVISVPDSGNPMANGFARESGLPKDDGLIKNRYVARTFIQPGQELRKHGLRMKFNPLREIVAGKRIVVVDDSIVRGNTTRQIVAMLKEAGAKEVHLRISAPPIRHPCHYGIDMSTREEMVAHNRSVEEIARELGADSLAYLSMDGVYEAIGTPRERHCDACFTGEYPLGDPEAANGKFALVSVGWVSAFRVAVLASGTGTNLQAILDRLHGRGGIEVVGVASDRPDARALERAEGLGITTATFPGPDYPDRPTRDAAIGDWLESMGTDLVVLAGYMQLLSPELVRRFPSRILNVHPALLPSFPGLDAIGQALDHGVKVTGVTVHFVDEGVDSGPIILQRPVAVPASRDRAELEAEVHRTEHELLPEAIRLIAAGRVSLDAGNRRLVRIDPE